MRLLRKTEYGGKKSLELGNTEKVVREKEMRMWILECFKR